MAIQKKHGKGRLDKWYRLAKEKGYRARAAFKLIQLNKKYGFLEKSKVLLDLCAAPGSWCQVAAECMPSQSLIVGVDLSPIKAIPKVITFQSDITTDKCRATIRQHFKTWKADTVLHDGAPNVGTAWVQDAFSQAELVLQSLKLATEFLVPGGTFVTKVFRSKDYNPLLWVFKQLFTTVEATKPPSSRNVSAEIFVVCLGFKAPKHIDPKFLDPKHVFAELQDPNPNNEAKVFNPEKKKRKRDGYEENDWTQHKELPATEFINTIDPISILGSYNKLTFTQSPGGDLALATLQRLPETTDEVRMCCEDLKVLGKKDFRQLLRWRIKVREKFGLAVKKGPRNDEETEEVAEVEPMDEELALQEDLKRMHERESSKNKRERRKENERKRKDIVRLQMNMTTPKEIGMEQAGPLGEGAMFKLQTAEKLPAARSVSASSMAAAIESSSEEEEDSGEEDSDEDADRLERQLDTLYSQYQEARESRDAKVRAKKSRKDYETEEWEGFSEKEEGEESDNESPQTFPIAPVGDHVNGLSNKAAMFFDQDIFRDLGAVEDGEASDDANATKTNGVTKGQSATAEKQATKKSRKAASPSPSTASDSSYQEVMLEKPENFDDDDNPRLNDDPRKKNGQLDVDIITAEAMALAHQMAKGEKTTEDFVDDGFHRYSFRDVDGLPQWFLDDENQHSKLQRPITAAAAAAIKEKMRAINARPIKKVREAKSRKKFKQAQKLEKLRKKSSLLAEDEGISERDKAQSIAKMISKATKKKPKQSVKLVVAKGGNKGISGRPRGVKGRYKIVDARMKKDIRAEKRLAKKKSK
ncbi:AdoMet-dependent rRNA methyltransferase spb1 [Nannizzia gypsea CBS 118893]|uniref:AdoMet-dependent rRNA methyltransferase spb1 n=1 Tax=Arthroderma gypseum (strain ATCC MYA-4604 / CBS 118893) TaxID=535722 RepID=E4V0Q0_ARTGP|nr:AdoMet-dependent rRNA methyltransferase spb1 [Nannizzia gypsea CBS 118893]EFR03187.1 AdoMet-dependent rRNA methyltransferase spb1 [Nannizzia gypsea CBS 118893]